MPMTSDTTTPTPTTTTLLLLQAMPILNKFMHHISLGHVAGAFGRWRDAVAQEVKVEQYAAASSQQRGVAILLRHLKYCRRRRVTMREV